MKTNSKRVAHVRDLAATCGLRTPGGRAPEAAWNSPEPVSTSGGSFPLATALSLGLGITHNSRLQEVNPKGIPSLSPGLRAASYPCACPAIKNGTNPSQSCNSWAMQSTSSVKQTLAEPENMQLVFTLLKAEAAITRNGLARELCH